MSSAPPPLGWQRRALRDLATIKKGTLVSAISGQGDVPYIGAESLSGGPTRMVTPGTNSLLIDPTDVVMLWDGERSGLCATGLAGVAGSTVARLRTSALIEPRFLYWALARKFNYIQAHRTGTGIPHVPKDLDTFLTVPLPVARDEQKQIVAILDTVDEAIHTTTRIIAKFEQIKEGLLNDLLGRGAADSRGLRQPSGLVGGAQNYELGLTPSQWTVAPLGEVGSFKNGLNKPKQAFGHGAKFVNIGDVYPDVLDVAALGRMEVTARELGDFALQPGDILIDRSSVKLDGVGYPTLFERAPEPVVFGGFIIRLRPSSHVNPKFLVLQMRMRTFRLRLFRYATVSANVNISQVSLAELSVLLPPRHEQDAIVKRVEFVVRRASNEARALRKARLIRAGLMEDLLTGRVRVKGALKVAA